MMGRVVWAAVCFFAVSTGLPVDVLKPQQQDDSISHDRKLLGSSVVTSVSVIMDHGNGTKTYITDGESPTIARPEIVGTPGTLMSPDRYEFYSFGKDGELVKKLMSLEEIQGLIAGGDELVSSEETLPIYYNEPLVQAGEPEGVSKVLESVQNVLKGELQAGGTQDRIEMPHVPDDSWTMLLSGLMNGDMDIKDQQVLKAPQPSTHKPTTKLSPPVKQTTPYYKPTIQIKSTTPRVTSYRPQFYTSSQNLKSSTPKPISYFNNNQQVTVQEAKKPTTTIKYSAHYTTPPPNLTQKTVQTTKQQTTVKKPTKRPEVMTTYQSVTKWTEDTRTPEKTRPSGIPSIIHYLPVQSVGPSDAPMPNKTTYRPMETIQTTQNHKPVIKTTTTTEEPITLKEVKIPSTMPSTTATAKPTTTNIPSTTKLPPPSLKTTATTTTLSTTPKPASTTKITTTTTTTQKPYVITNRTTTQKITIPDKTTLPPTKLQTKVQVTTAKPVENFITLNAEKLVQKNPVANLQAESSNLEAVKIQVPTTYRPTYNKQNVTVKPVTTESAILTSLKTIQRLTTTPLPKTTHKIDSSITNLKVDSPISTHLPMGVSTQTTTTTPIPNKSSWSQVAISTTLPPKTPADPIPTVKVAVTTKKIPVTITTTTTAKTSTTTTTTTTTTTGKPTTVRTTTVTEPSTTQELLTTKFDTTLDQDTTTKRMPVEEIPLKIYESLKDPETNVFELSSLPDITSIKDSTTPPGTTISEPSTMESTTNYFKTTINDLKTTSNDFKTTENDFKTTENDFKTTENDFKSTTLNSETTQIFDKELQASETQIFNQTHDRNNKVTTPSQDTTTYVPTTDSSTIQQSTETATLATTPYKDQVMEEGISAVTNILLDSMKNAFLRENSTISDIRSSPEFIQSTTEYKTTQEESTMYDKSETRTAEEQTEAEISTTDNPTTETTRKEKTTTSIPTTTTNTPKSTTTAKATTILSSTVKLDLTPKFKTDIQKENKPVIPSKVSKLNPDMPEGDKNSLQKLEIINATTTVKPETVQEQVKLQEVEKPTKYAVKKPSYQNLEAVQPPAAIDLHPAPYESMGLEASTAFLGEDVRRFADLCNELAFRLWTAMTGKGQIASRSIIMSPFAATSLLAMVFLGARGATSGQMNDILRLDDMVTFNPHQVLQNVTDSVINSKNNGVATASFVRQLYSDKSKGKILDFYKERAQQYYQGHVEEINFNAIGDIVRRRTNLLVKRQTLGKIPEYLRGSSLSMRPPLAAFSANIFQTDCDLGSTEGRDGEMYFVVRPSTRQRRLVPVPAVVWRTGFLAGYEPSLDATSVCLGADSMVSTILVLPGQQGQVAPGDGLARLEQRLIETSYRRGGWSRLLRSLLPRPGLELQIPRFSHRSVLNVTSALVRMGLKDLFESKADLRGLNGLSNDLHLSDMVQINTFSTCGEEIIGARHHVETYPASPQRMGREDPEYYPPRDFDNAFGDIPLSLRPRQARLPDNPRLRFDRPFLYMVRHNPSGMILHMGRFNPRLLP